MWVFGSSSSDLCEFAFFHLFIVYQIWKCNFLFIKESWVSFFTKLLSSTLSHVTWPLNVSHNIKNLNMCNIDTTFVWFLCDTCVAWWKVLGMIMSRRDAQDLEFSTIFIHFPLYELIVEKWKSGDFPKFSYSFHLNQIGIFRLERSSWPRQA
jgi:hypothetical protein